MTGPPDGERIEAYLASLPLSRQTGLDEAMRYSLLAGGKRIRPRLCLAAVRCAGGDVERALPAAAAVELVHTFSLVHDDLPALDDDDLRRGLPTAHVRFGEGAAVLAGDALLTEAFRLVSDRLDAAADVRLAVLGELAGGVAAMIEGQYVDIAGGGDDAASLDELHRLKTGALIAASVGIGLHVGGMPAARQAPVRAFADDLGVLFQAVDDVLDASGDRVTLGREPGRDAAAGRRTAVSVHGLAGARGVALAAHGRCLERLAAADGDAAALRAIADDVVARLP
jgi:geranylgeranyl diphosphate synthase type II